MKKLIFLFLILAQAQAQSILSNGSFEDNPLCGSTPDDCSPWQTLAGQPIIATVCNTQFPVPTNIYGTQTPFEGDAYLILRTFSDSLASRQFVGAMLDNSILTGDVVTVSMRISHADSTGYGANQLCVLFSAGSFTNTVPFGGSDTFHLKVDTIIEEENGWAHFNESFIAVSNYDRIELGNVFTDTQTQFDTINNPAPHQKDARYFIDSITVTVSHPSPIGGDDIPPSPRLMNSTNIWGPVWRLEYSDGRIEKDIRLEKSEAGN